MKGDEIFVLSGARVPFVFRARADGTYRLVGEIYVHGIMRGEAFEYMDMVEERVTLLKVQETFNFHQINTT